MTPKQRSGRARYVALCRQNMQIAVDEMARNPGNETIAERCRGCIDWYRQAAEQAEAELEATP